MDDVRSKRFLLLKGEISGDEWHLCEGENGGRLHF